jgi:hypothetical protein
MSKVNYRRKNPVARVMNDYNRPKTERDRTKYSRKAKYRTFG